MTKETVLITGASKGIGRELAIIFAEKGCNLLLAARSERELSELKVLLEKEYAVKVQTFYSDLSLPDAAQHLFEAVKSQGNDVDYLVNNAGFGDYGAFADTYWERYGKMIQLNVTSLTQLTHLFVSQWRGRKKGKILNVSSTAAFQPGPMMAVYFASKAFVLSLSEAIDNELRTEGITVTALCPGPTATHFGEESKMNASQLVKNVQIASARSVALMGYRAMMKGKPVVIHGTMNKVAPFFIRFIPRKWVTRLSAQIMKK